MQEEKISLYYKDARSDKEYHLQLLADGEGYSVHYQNGPRGGTLASGKKTAAPVDYSVAKKAFDKVVKEKTGKGYVPGEAGTAFVGGDLADRVTGVLLQLLNPISVVEAETYLCDPNWVLQEKKDGRRRAVKLAEGNLVGVNRKGLSSGLPQTVVDAVMLLSKQHAFTAITLDGELVGDVLYLFDVLDVEGKDLRENGYEGRLQVLEHFNSTLTDAAASGIVCVPTARTEAAKRRFFAELQARKAEGVVFKEITAAYVAGRPSCGGTQLKCKFVKSATLVVEKLHATKRSIHVAALGEDGALVSLGKCTIPPNQAIPAVGDLVELEYLYAYPGGSLFQPVYKGPRDDIERSACTLAQLHYKAGTEAEDEDV